MADGQSKQDDVSKYLRENLTDLQEFAKKKLESTGKKKMQSDEESSNALDWNIRNWGNFWDDNPGFDNH